MYLVVLSKCDRVFDADFRNDIHISEKKTTISTGDFKEIVKADK